MANARPTSFQSEISLFRVISEVTMLSRLSVMSSTVCVSKKSIVGFLYTPRITSLPPITPIGFVSSRTTMESVNVSKYCTSIPVATLTLAFFLTFTTGVDVSEFGNNSPNGRLETVELDPVKTNEISVKLTY